MLRHVLAGCVALSCVALATGAWGAAPQTTELDQGWRFRISPSDAAVHPDAATWMPAHVPGVVQTDLMALGKLADPYVGDNEGKVQWVGLADWDYETHVDVSADTLAHDHVDLVFEGLDTFATVKINGVEALKSDNMFRTWRIAAKALLRPGDNVISVAIASPIRTLQPLLAGIKNVLPGAYDSAFGDEAPGRDSSTYVRKAGYQYGWDWGPRVVALGVWKPVRLEAYDALRLEDSHVDQVHLDDDVAVVEAQTELQSENAGQATITVEIKGPDGSDLTQTQTTDLYAGSNTVRMPMRIVKPRRWWPVGYGKPDLYTVRTTVTQGGGVVGEATHTIGLRTIELRRDKDQWGRSFALVINGVPVFAKGANLIPFDIFPTRVTAKQQDQILQSAVDANMNILRIWGGGIYQDDHVYEKADELGLMIWQDFMFGGAIPPSDEAFRANTEAEAVEQVKRLRDHPSIVLWDGANEVQTDWENWSGSTTAFKAALTPDDRDRVVMGMMRIFDRTLRDAVQQYDPQVPYWATTPSTDYEGPADQDSDGDRHYWSVWGGKPVETYLDETPRFMSEYGLQSFPDMATLQTFATPADMSPETPVMRAHQKYDKGNGNKRLLLYIHNNYGEPKSFADFVYLSQLMQAEGIELAATHLRAARPQNMGTMYWQINDVWPGASWASVDYYGRWKALQYHARRFYAPLAVSFLRKDCVSEAHVLSDLTAATPVAWRVTVRDFAGRTLNRKTGTMTVAPLTSPAIGSFADADLLNGADPKTSQAELELLQNGQVVAKTFVYFGPAKALKWSDPKLESRIAQAADGYDVTVSAGSAARGVWIDTGALEVSLSDNAFDMTGGETVTVHVKTSANPRAFVRALKVRSYYGSATAGAS